MTDRIKAQETAERFFEDLWLKGDPWHLETSPFEQEKYATEIGMLKGRHFTDALEIGCGAGAFTRLLAPWCDHVLALDISSTAITRARSRNPELSNVDFRVENAMDLKPPDQSWNLIVMNETIYYLGWLYSFFDVSWFASELFRATRNGGQLLMANTSGAPGDYLMAPAVVRTYHDLFANVGYESEHREFRGTKDGVAFDVLISLFTRPAR